MPAVSGRYIVCPFCNSKKCKKECKSKKEGGISMYDKIYEIIQSADDFVWGWGMIALLLGTHLFLTVRTGLIQRKTITKGIRLSVAKEEGADGEVSQFGALATALASTIGTGNIIGVGTAIALGGPGAVFWCWITGIFGIATKYAESLIAVKYRVKTEDGRMQGGAMYALERGLNMRWLGLAFAFLAGFASFGIGCATQVNAIAEVCSKNLGIDPFVVGVVVAGMTAVFFGALDVFFRLGFDIFLRTYCGLCVAHRAGCNVHFGGYVFAEHYYGNHYCCRNQHCYNNVFHHYGAFSFYGDVHFISPFDKIVMLSIKSGNFPIFVKLSID